MLASIGLGGCEKPESVEIARNDHAMTLAMAEARASVDEFLAAIRDPGPNRSGFAVKIGLKAGRRVDYVWLTDVTLSGNELTGTVANDPPNVKTARKGDRRTVAPGEIVDWAYFEDGMRVGARTDALLERRAADGE